MSPNTTGAKETWSGQIVFKRWKLKRGQQLIITANENNTDSIHDRDHFATDI
jgi:hypothetical protein